MDLQVIIDFWDSQTFLGVTLGILFSFSTIAVGAFVTERVITRFLRKFQKTARLEPNVTNSLVLTFRIPGLIAPADGTLQEQKLNHPKKSVFYEFVAAVLCVDRLVLKKFTQCLEDFLFRFSKLLRDLGKC